MSEIASAFQPHASYVTIRPLHFLLRTRTRERRNQ
nr:MAG TPA: hypothetical protein [Caudoviricetes sp.]DAI24908.1 MAG TPA: hypothetical protein [Caudoviricetes sp.]DAN53547.1 MAG TPA: hypothetical protein [Caudoviricetes sp.]DAP30181.1 MAG TPA: hypothetical protein [Caudoviricetes sp.]